MPKQINATSPRRSEFNFPAGVPQFSPTRNSFEFYDKTTQPGRNGLTNFVNTVTIIIKLSFGAKFTHYLTNASEQALRDETF